MAQGMNRYRSGRFIAALFTVLGWLGLIVTVPLLIVGLTKGAGGSAAASGFVWLAWSLGGVLFGQIGRAVFDMAEHRLGQAGR